MTDAPVDIATPLPDDSVVNAVPVWGRRGIVIVDDRPPARAFPGWPDGLGRHDTAGIVVTGGAGSGVLAADPSVAFNHGRMT